MRAATRRNASVDAALACGGDVRGETDAAPVVPPTRARRAPHLDRDSVAERAARARAVDATEAAAADLFAERADQLVRVEPPAREQREHAARRREVSLHVGPPQHLREQLVVEERPMRSVAELDAQRRELRADLDGRAAVRRRRRTLYVDPVHRLVSERLSSGPPSMRERATSSKFWRTRLTRNDGAATERSADCWVPFRTCQFRHKMSRSLPQ